MKGLIYSFAATGAALFLIAQAPQKPEPYPGQSQHKEPPPGWFCSRDAKDPAHVCKCKRMVMEKDLCEGEPIEDATCSSYCWKQHCHCPVTCETPAHGGHQ